MLAALFLNLVILEAVLGQVEATNGGMDCVEPKLPSCFAGESFNQDSVNAGDTPGVAMLLLFDDELVVRAELLDNKRVGVGAALGFIRVNQVEVLLG